MESKGWLTKTLAIVGTSLVWLPVLSPVFLSAIRLISGRRFLLDYLLPAELFPVAFAGGGLLLWAAFRAQARRGIIGGGLGAAAGLLAGGQTLAVVTGLASGDTEPTGWPWALVIASLGLYGVALAVMGVGGGLLLRDLYQPAGRPTSRA